MTEEQKEVVDVHLVIEELKHPDLLLQYDGKKTPEEQVADILRNWKWKSEF